MKFTVTQQHPFHLVDSSPWPLFMGCSALCTTFGFVMYLHAYYYGGLIGFIGFVCVLCTLTLWWRDVIREATFEGRHTKPVQQGLKYGMLLFIVSEIMFFFAFFWAFFHSSLVPAIELGCVWPPAGMPIIETFGVPLLNTIILLSSGATLTWAHHALREGDHGATAVGLVYTLILAIFFTGLQAMEYIDSAFTISDGVYGSTFFMATGFHGFHVIMGTTFLAICLVRHVHYHFTKEHHIGFEFAAWYWHFVDVVWLFLFVSVYWWGNSMPS